MFHRYGIALYLAIGQFQISYLLSNMLLFHWFFFFISHCQKNWLEWEEIKGFLPLLILRTKGKLALFHSLPCLSNLSLLVPFHSIIQTLLEVGLVLWGEKAINEYSVFISIAPFIAVRHPITWSQKNVRTAWNPDQQSLQIIDWWWC